MSIHKSQSLVLATAPYRESSMLLHLFSRELGRIHGLAKGIRRGDKRGVLIERGNLIEHTVYLKPQRELHLITDSSISEYYPNIRNNLEKTAVRDVVLDIALAAIKDTEPHETLYDAIIEYYNHLSDNTFADDLLLLFLSRQLFQVARELGFGIDFDSCSQCRESFKNAGGGTLVVSGGVCICAGCMPYVNKAGSWALPTPVLSILQSEKVPATASGNSMVGTEEAMAAVHAAIEFCRYHLDVRRKLGSVVFLDQLFTMATIRKTH